MINANWHLMNKIIVHFQIVTVLDLKLTSRHVPIPTVKKLFPKLSNKLNPVNVLTMNIILIFNSLLIYAIITLRYLNQKL